MHNIIKLYNQNRVKIWTLTISVTIIAIIIWNLINMVANREETSSEIQVPEINETTFNSISLESTKSAITRQDISSNKDEITVIDEFKAYCNEKKLQEAYNLISDECKEKMYPNFKNFYDRYYTPIFGGDKKNVTIENWVGNIYKVDFAENFLATGRYTDENTKQDYITIVTSSDGSYKLNINKYIRTNNINQTETFGNVSITVTERDVYMDYEIYTFGIANNSLQTISLCNTAVVGETYLIGENDIKYNAATSELSQEDVICDEGITKSVQIKYLNAYGSTKETKGIVFLKVDFNYNSTNKQYKEIIFNI